MTNEVEIIRVLSTISQQIGALHEEIANIRVEQRDYADQIAQLISKCEGQLSIIRVRGAP
jgi:hypothetical protein